MPGHILITRLLLDPLTDQDLDHPRDIMTRVRDHMRAHPPDPPPPKRRPAPAWESALMQPDRDGGAPDP